MFHDASISSFFREVINDLVEGKDEEGNYVLICDKKWILSNVAEILSYIGYFVSYDGVKTITIR